MSNEPKLSVLSRIRPTEILRHLRHYLGIGDPRRREPVNDRASLRRFLDTRAAYIAQTSLYGYLRTRSGMLYPQLFDNDEFVAQVNVAKWHLWLACLSDLTVYTGGLIVNREPRSLDRVGPLLQATVAEIIEEKDNPEEAGHEFASHAREVLSRVRDTHWTGVTDDEGPFSESPEALVRWSPVTEELKVLDGSIVKNSVRYHWQEIRRDLRRDLDAAAVLESLGED